MTDTAAIRPALLALYRCRTPGPGLSAAAAQFSEPSGISRPRQATPLAPQRFSDELYQVAARFGFSHRAKLR